MIKHRPPDTVLSVRVTQPLAAEIRRRAVGNGVTISTYVAALLAEHTDESPLFGVAPRPSGLIAASTRTRKRVSRAGVKGRKRENAKAKKVTVNRG